MAERVGIFGMACRVPGARTPNALWQFTCGGHRAFRSLAPERIDPSLYARELPADLPSPLLGGLLDDFSVDWRALRLPPLQVERMHRMERAALATMIEALADAGIGVENGIADRGRIFVAASTLGPDPLVDHGPRIRRFELAAPIAQALREHIPAEAPEIERALERMFDERAPRVEPDSMRVTASMTAGRVAALFDWRGGHLAVDAASASSLVAIEEAVGAIEAGNCDVVLVAGIAPLLTPFTIGAFARCHGFAAAPAADQANGGGTLLGEGCAAVVLAREGVLAGVPPRAWIASVAAVHGQGNDDATAVRDAVERATTGALERAQTVEGIASVETRACGIGWADGAERSALLAAYARAGREDPALTSAVPNIGFLQSASGMVALVRAVSGLAQRRWQSDAVGLSDAGLDRVAVHAVLTHPSRSAELTRAARSPTPGRAHLEGTAPEAVAIVGMGVALPRAAALETFWDNIVSRVESIGDFPPTRWDVDQLIGSGDEVGALLTTRLASVVASDELLSDSLPTRAVDPAEVLAFRSAERALADVLSPRDAIAPDGIRVIVGQIPFRAAEAGWERQLLFAEHLDFAARAMRDAGVDERDVEAVIADARRRLAGERLPETLSFCSGLTVASQIARAHGFLGSVFSVDAACASSLAAIEAGVRALRDGTSDMVVAGGVAYNLLPEYYIALSMLGALSPRAVPPFHRGARGFVPGEGAATLVLKRLSDAEHDGDRVYAVIRGIGATSDGRSSSIFAPNADSQAAAIRRALATAGVEPASIDLIEAHGAGTPIGDRAEIAAYAETYANRDVSAPISLGTVKSVIGHLSSAAGAAGMVKAALALRQRTLPPSGGDGVPDPELPIGRLPIELATQPRPWVTAPGRRRRAALSAFGLGGVNYHVVLEEADYTAAKLRRTLPWRLVHPAPLPARGTLADRFTIELVPLSLDRAQRRFPLAGKRLALVTDRGEVWRSIVRALESRGAHVLTLSRGGTIESALSTAGAPWDTLRLHEIDGIIDASTFVATTGGEASGTAAIVDAAREAGRYAFPLLGSLYERLADAARPACAIAVTSLGGTLGLTGVDDAALSGSFLLGLGKGLKQELPHLVVKTVDFAPTVAADQLARLLADEIESGTDRMEVAYTPRRYVPNLVRASFAEDTPVTRPIMSGDVALISGGGRGVLYECACALARLGVETVVTGRTPPLYGEPEWANLSDADFEAYRREQLARRFKRDRITPVEFAREFELVVRQRELHRNLGRARAADLPIHYERADVTNADEVRDMVQRVRQTLGPIDLLVHGAMVEHSTSLPRKSQASVERGTMTKVAGLLHLIDAVAEEPPRVVMAFSSGAARFGNRGQSDYAAANAMMTAALASRALSLKTHCVTVDWTAWKTVGAAVANRDVEAMIRSLGLSAISPDEGTYWFLSELAMGASGEVVVMEERMLHEWAFLGVSADGSGADAPQTDDEGRPLVPGRWPMIDRIVERTDSTLRVERVLDPSRDHFLRQHRLHDVPILPFTFGCELLAEGAALFAPDWTLERLEEVRIDVPVKFFRDAAVSLRTSVTLLSDDGETRVLAVETRSDFSRAGVLLQRDRLHHSARAVLRRSRRKAGLPIDIRDRPGLVKSRSLFQGAKDPVELGPLFWNAAWIQTFEREVIGSVRAPQQRELFRATSLPVFQVDPLVLDAAFQIAANWDGHHNHVVPIPISVERISLSDTRLASQNVRVRVAMVRVDDPDVVYDLVTATEDGTPLMKVAGLRMRRVGPLKVDPNG